MYFLGQAANFKFMDTVRHTFAIGTKKSSKKLKEHLAKRYKVSEENVFLYHNGRSALSAGLRATVPKKNGEHPGVVLTSLTCYAVVEAIKSAGFTPVFADIEPNTLHFDGETLEKTLRKHKNVKAVIVQNNLGMPCDIKSIEASVRKHNLVLVEDLAHCAGISYKDGREAGTIGDFAALSFGKGKSIDTISGGALVIRSKEITYRTERGRYETKIVKLPKAPTKKPKFGDRFRDRFYPSFGLDIRILYRIHLGKLYTSLLLKLHLIKRSADATLDLKTRLTHWQAKLALKQLERIPKNRPPIREFFLVEDRDETLKELEKAGFIMNDTWYDVPVSPIRYYDKVGYPENECPVAMEIAKHIVNLPNHYPRTKLVKARKIIEKHLMKGGK
jgi:dTDP-4-amino-4,6-dideoxygalactose transaminase